MKYFIKTNQQLQQKWLLTVFLIVFQMLNTAVFAQKNEVEKEIWQLENRYWNYLERNDITSCKQLWINNQINYQLTEANLSDVNKCSFWMTAINKNSELEFSCALHKKSIEITKNSVIITYDVDKFWTDKQHNLHNSERFSFSHTWIKSQNSWLLSDGLAIKN